MHKGMPLHLHFIPRASHSRFGVAAQDHTAKRASSRVRLHCYVDSESRSTLEVDAADLVLAADAEQDYEPAQGYNMRREARWNLTLAANPLASPAPRVGTFPHSLPAEEGGALTSLMIARALGTTVEQVGLASGNCHTLIGRLRWKLGWVFRPASCLTPACLRQTVKCTFHNGCCGTPRVLHLCLSQGRQADLPPAHSQHRLTAHEMQGP